MMQLDFFFEVLNETQEEHDLKTCVGCNNKKGLDSFRVLVRRHGDRHTLSSTCIACDDKASKIKSEWRKNNNLPEDYACPICNMTHKDYLEMGKYKTQSPFSVDHCQHSMKVRGWICNPCNSAMGLAKHNVDILYKMIEHLNERT